MMNKLGRVFLAGITFTAMACSSGIGSVPVTLDAPLDAAKKYRLAVVFTQFDDDYAGPAVDVAYDVPFDPTSTTIDLPSLEAPSAANILCVRKDKQRGQPPGACDADSPYKIGIGYVVIVEDGNGNGKADFTTSGGDGSAKIVAPDVIARVGMGAIVYDEKGGSVLPSSPELPALVEGTVPAGMTLYEAYRPAGKTFDRLRVRTVPLVLSAKGPNLT